jgi:hypothetical protein
MSLKLALATVTPTCTRDAKSKRITSKGRNLYALFTQATNLSAIANEIADSNVGKVESIASIRIVPPDAAAAAAGAEGQAVHHLLWVSIMDDKQMSHSVLDDAISTVGSAGLVGFGSLDRSVTDHHVKKLKGAEILFPGTQQQPQQQAEEDLSDSTAETSSVPAKAPAKRKSAALNNSSSSKQQRHEKRRATVARSGAAAAAAAASVQSTDNDVSSSSSRKQKRFAQKRKAAAAAASSDSDSSSDSGSGDNSDSNSVQQRRSASTSVTSRSTAAAAAADRDSSESYMDGRGAEQQQPVAASTSAAAAAAAAASGDVAADYNPDDCSSNRVAAKRRYGESSSSSSSSSSNNSMQWNARPELDQTAVDSAKRALPSSASSSSSRSVVQKSAGLAAVATKLSIEDCSLDAVLFAVEMLQAGAASALQEMSTVRSNERKRRADAESLEKDLSCKLRDGLLMLGDIHGLRTTLLEEVS